MNGLPEPAWSETLTRRQRQEIQRWYEQAVRLSDDQPREARRRLRACLHHDLCNSLYVELFLRVLPRGAGRRRGEGGWGGVVCHAA